MGPKLSVDRVTRQAVAHQFPPAWSRACLPQGVDISTDRDLPPQTLLGVLWEPLRVHH